MARKMKIEPDVVFTGGVAKNAGVARALGEKLGCEIFIPDEPLLSGALGAALLARETVLTALEKGESLQRGKHRLEEVTFFN
jgi:activator of 2-hydroxyglutaryl-CoA dehydratase